MSLSLEAAAASASSSFNHGGAPADMRTAAAATHRIRVIPFPYRRGASGIRKKPRGGRPSRGRRIPVELLRRRLGGLLHLLERLLLRRADRAQARLSALAVDEPLALLERRREVDERRDRRDLELLRQVVVAADLLDEDHPVVVLADPRMRQRLQDLGRRLLVIAER